MSPHFTIVHSQLSMWLLRTYYYFSLSFEALFCISWLMLLELLNLVLHDIIIFANNCTFRIICITCTLANQLRPRLTAKRRKLDQRKSSCSQISKQEWSRLPSGDNTYIVYFSIKQVWKTSPRITLTIIEAFC